MGVNAVHRLGPLLDRIGEWSERRPVIDGCEYREALQAVGVRGGVAANVVPDEAVVSLNHRFAPDRDERTAESSVREFLAPMIEAGRGDRIDVTDSAPAAAPALDHPMLARLVAASGARPRAKLGWTDVALFTERGIPAANFGPGDPELAHTPGEFVTRAELGAAYRTLRLVLTSG
jgi:succinyl-diaminopimelate desuccinylase